MTALTTAPSAHSSVASAVSAAPAGGRALPPGFRPLRVGTETDFLALTGPFAMKIADGQLRLGFYVQPKHCNVAGICHGGMLLTFADIQMAIAGKHQEDLQGFHMTVSLTCDFLGAGKLGGWMEGRTEVVRNVDRTLFAQCILTCDGETVLRASAVFREGAATPEMVERMRLKS